MGPTGTACSARMHLTQVPPGVLISAGMTCTVVIKQGAAPEIARGIKKVMTAFLEHLRVSAMPVLVERDRSLLDRALWPYHARELQHRIGVLPEGLTPVADRGHRSRRPPDPY